MIKEISKYQDNSSDKLLKILFETNSLQYNEENLRKYCPDIFETDFDYMKFLREMNKIKNIKEAAEEIREAIKNKEKIRVHGDYDGDGIFSTVILVEALRAMEADVDFKIPNRLEDDYGIKLSDIEKDVADGVKCIVTCDNGISCKEAVDYALNNNIRVIVTDHHIPNEGLVPQNVVVVDPKYTEDQFTDISGGFVALKLATELLGISLLTKELLGELVVFAAITTITDLMPLLNENRLLLRCAFKYIDFLKDRKIWRGRVLKVISALGGYYFINKDDNIIASTDLFAFLIGPAINAVSRVNGDVSDLVQAILDCDKDGFYIPSSFSAFNTIRKNRTKEIYDSYVSEDMPVAITVIDQAQFDYKVGGLLGLIANKICSTENKPSLVGVVRGDKISFSGRSIPGYSLQGAIQRIKESHPDMVITGGGHDQAMGINIEKTDLEEFTESFNKDFMDNFNPEELEKRLSEFKLEDENITEIVEMHERFKIFGAGLRPFQMYFEGYIDEMTPNTLISDGYAFRYYLAKDVENPFAIGKKVKLHFSIQTDDVLSGPYFKINKYEVEGEGE